jgi:hypothetical protein
MGDAKSRHNVLIPDSDMEILMNLLSINKPSRVIRKAVRILRRLEPYMTVDDDGTISLKVLNKDNETETLIIL